MMALLANVRSVGNFLKAFWTSRHGRIRSTNLFNELSEKYPSAETTIDLSSDMLAAAEFYAALEVSDDPIWAGYSPEARVSVRDLKEFESQEMRRLLHLIEVIIVRHLLTMSGSTGKLETSAAILARKIYAGEIVSAALAFQELKDYYPNDTDFQQFFATKTESSNQKAQYLLRCIEMEAIRQDQGQDAGKELSPAALTIEHVLPKNPGPEWDGVIEGDSAIVDDCALRMGNMCLTSDAANQKAGGKSFEAKRKVFEASELITTRAIAKRDRWDRKNVEHHQLYLAKLAAQAWRFP
jgi:hypothetical protein